jgi:VWFA-related protein
MKLTHTPLRLAAVLAVAALCHAQDTMEVIVTSKGAPLKGLAAKDFKLTLDGKDQPVTDAFLGKEAAGDKMRRQTYIMLFDTVSLKASEHTDLRRQLQGFVDSSARPDRSFAVLTYSGTIRQIQGFTSDAAAIKAAIDKAVTGAVSVAVDWRNFLDSISGLARAIGPMPGRKTILFFTNGQLAAVNTADNSDSARGVPKNSGRQAETSGDIDKVIDTVRAADMVFHTVSHSTGVDRNLSDGTKGSTVRVSNNLSDQLTKITDEQDATYVVTYTPSGNLKEGCHKVAAKVAASGADVKTRQILCD